MDTTLLRRQKAEAVEAARAVLRAAEAEDRGLTEVETATYDSHVARMRDLGQRIEREEEIGRAEAELEARQPSPLSRRGDDAADPDTDALLRVARGEQREHELSLRGLGRSVRRDGTYELRRHGRVLNTSDDGAIVPVTFVAQLFEALVEESTVRQANVTILSTDSGEPMTVPYVASRAAGTAVSEGGTIAGTEPTFAQGTLLAHKRGVLIPVSRELLDDSGIDLTGYLARSVGQVLGTEFGARYVTGSGSGEPLGFLVASSGHAGTVVGGTGVAGAPTFANLATLYTKVLGPRRARGHWFVSDTALAALIGLVDTTGRPIYVSSLASGAPDTLFGRPVHSDPAMPAMAVGGTSIAFGDFRGYHIRDVNGVRFERSDDFRFDEDLVVFRALMRSDGRQLDPAGVAVFKGGTA